MGELAALTAEQHRAVVAIVEDRVKEIRSTGEEFDGLRRAVEELAEAQARTSAIRSWCIWASTWWTVSPERWECAWAEALSRLPGATVPLLGFGASDCAVWLICYALPIALRPGRSTGRAMRSVPHPLGRSRLTIC